ncbi:MAG: T9SS type A sorting domain-containing protein [Crocinitomicaceae bacterium]|nr:T9SS type A sorting domain-containing protein [Crocinitomicaceae bacterium]
MNFKALCFLLSTLCALTGNTQSISIQLVSGTEGVIWGPNHLFGEDEIENVKVYKNELYFAGEHTTLGPGLFKLDSMNNVVHVADVSDLNGTEANPSHLTVLGDQLIFTCSNSIVGTELWSYDGINPPSLVSDIELGTASSFPTQLSVAGGNLYFAATTASEGTELYIYDGTSSPSIIMSNPGTSCVFPIYMRSYKDSAVVFRGIDNAGTADIILLDAATNTPVEISNFNATNFQIFGDIGVLGNQIIFSYDDAGSISAEPYMYNGSGTASLLADINPAGPSISEGRYTEHNGILYFMAGSTFMNTELWQYDGVNPPSIVEDKNQNGSSFVFEMISYDSCLIISSDHVWDIDAQGELHLVEGNSISLIEDLYPGPIGSNAQDFEIHNDKLYFLGRYNGGGNALYVLDKEDNSAGIEINENEHEFFQITLFPNPTNDNVSLKAKEDLYPFEVQIIDQRGELLETKQILSADDYLSLNKLKIGLYYFKIKTNNFTEIHRISKI